VKDTIDDIIGMVKSMTLFGSGTRPNRNPLRPEENGKFYTVPVKFTFASKQIAIRVTEVLKGKYKLPITTPYHKSLRACFTHVQKKVRSMNPGYQVRVNLDVKNRLLKASVRPADKAPWELLTQTFPLPTEALDPKFQDVKTMVLGTPTKSPPLRHPSDSNMDCLEDGNTKASSPPGKNRGSNKPPTPSKENSAAISKTTGGTGVSNRFSALARTPPPSKPKGKDGAAG
jgi:hypothetical protein